ncbi:F-box protein SKIP14-like [Typha angustifolia]|uniref:F-box protein SKIP14-like n=1 Tax=Typha angustifolia TaxID=59011 RepID=UPI003C2C356B
MALNFSSCSVFPSSIGMDDDCSSRSRREGLGGSYSSENPFACRGNRGWREADDYRDPVDLLPSDPFGMNLETTFTAAIASWMGDLRASHHDMVDLLPSDPFGMNLETTFTAAIASWIGDLGAVSGSYEVGGNNLLAELSYYWNRALMVSSEARGNYGGPVGGQEEESSSGLSDFEVQDDIFQSIADVKELPSSSGAESASSSQDEGIPHEGLLFALGSLGVQDLLSVERVCKYLCAAVQNDPLLWRCIHIEPQLSEKITDDALFRLTQKAQGSLQCLSLVGCSNITDDGLRVVLEHNPRLSKLNVLGCVRLSLVGLINNMKAFKAPGTAGIKHLRIGRLFRVSEEQFEELKSLLGIDQFQKSSARKQRFYHVGQSSSDCDDDCALDIEMCPLCNKYKLVYDCPLESCRAKGPEVCMACDVCIARCIQCGKCIKDSEYVETFFFEFLCSDCWNQPPISQESSKKK